MNSSYFENDDEYYCPTFKNYLHQNCSGRLVIFGILWALYLSVFIFYVILVGKALNGEIPAPELSWTCKCYQNFSLFLNGTERWCCPTPLENNSTNCLQPYYLANEKFTHLGQVVIALGLSLALGGVIKLGLVVVFIEGIYRLTRKIYVYFMGSCIIIAIVLFAVTMFHIFSDIDCPIVPKG